MVGWSQSMAPALVLLRDAVAVGVAEAVDVVEPGAVGGLVAGGAGRREVPRDAELRPPAVVTLRDGVVEQAEHQAVVEEAARASAIAFIWMFGSLRRAFAVGIDVDVEADVPQPRHRGFRAGADRQRVGLEVDGRDREEVDQVVERHRGEAEQPGDVVDLVTRTAAIVERHQPHRRHVGDLELDVLGQQVVLVCSARRRCS